MSRHFFVSKNEFAIIIGGKIVAQDTLDSRKFIKAVRQIYQKNWGVIDELIIDNWIKEFSKPIGADKYA